MYTNAIPVARGCGTRKKGGCYAECGLSDDGLPLEHFLFDPPIVLTKEARDKLGIIDRGVRLFQEERMCWMCDGDGSILVNGIHQDCSTCFGKGKYVV